MPESELSLTDLPIIAWGPAAKNVAKLSNLEVVQLRLYDSREGEIVFEVEKNVLCIMLKVSFASCSKWVGILCIMPKVCRYTWYNKGS